MVDLSLKKEPTWLTTKIPGFIFYFGEPDHISGNGKHVHRSTTEFIGTKLAGWELCLK